jgi:hypothetical protein
MDTTGHQAEIAKKPTEVPGRKVFIPYNWEFFFYKKRGDWILNVS